VPTIEAALIAGAVSLITALVTATITVGVAERRARRDFALEFAAERVARQLLDSPKWKWRSFAMFQYYLGGFDDDELRKLLVRAGAIKCLTDKGVEMWCLLDRNPGLGRPVGEPNDPTASPDLA
jgi:hypothetical protein